MDNELTALCFLGLSFTIAKVLNYVDKSNKKEHLSEREIQKRRNFKLLENNDLDAIKQLIEKEVFFKALVLVIEEQKKGLLAVTKLGNNPCLVWSDESTNRAYRLSFKDGLSHSRLYSSQPYNSGITIPFSMSLEETKFWHDVHSYFSDLEKKELVRLEQEKLETERLAEIKRKEDIKRAEAVFFSNVAN